MCPYQDSWIDGRTDVRPGWGGGAEEKAIRCPCSKRIGGTVPFQRGSLVNGLLLFLVIHISLTSPCLRKSRTWEQVSLLQPDQYLLYNPSTLKQFKRQNLPLIQMTTRPHGRGRNSKFVLSHIPFHFSKVTSFWHIDDDSWTRPYDRHDCWHTQHYSATGESDGSRNQRAQWVCPSCPLFCFSDHIMFLGCWPIWNGMLMYLTTSWMTPCGGWGNFWETLKRGGVVGVSLYWWLC